jgi:hypothetical protein
MKKQQYIKDLTRLLTPKQIKLSAANPSAYMSRTHIRLHYVALRRIGMLP